MPVGETKDAGWQIGVSRTLDIPAGALWEWLTGPGMTVWLGDGVVLARGEPYETLDGTTGEVRSYRGGDRIRLTWRPPGWTTTPPSRWPSRPRGREPCCASTRSV